MIWSSDCRVQAAWYCWLNGCDWTISSWIQVLKFRSFYLIQIHLTCIIQLTRNSTWRSCDVCVNQFAEKTQKMARWRLDPASRQCTGTHFTFCAAVFDQTLYRSVAAVAILTRSRTVWFFLFPRLKKVLKGHRFEATEDIKRNSTKTQLDIPKEEFAKCFHQWQKRWAKCVAAEGNCVEDN